jgi:hypothetical protein
MNTDRSVKWGILYRRLINLYGRYITLYNTGLEGLASFSKGAI